MQHTENCTPSDMKRSLGSRPPKLVWTGVEKPSESRKNRRTPPPEVVSLGLIFRTMPIVRARGLSKAKPRDRTKFLIYPSISSHISGFMYTGPRFSIDNFSSLCRDRRRMLIGDCGFQKSLEKTFLLLNSSTRQVLYHTVLNSQGGQKGNTFSLSQKSYFSRNEFRPTLLCLWNLVPQNMPIQLY